MIANTRFTAEKIEKRIALIRPLIQRDPQPLAPFTLELLPYASAAPGSGEDRGEVPWNSYWAGQDTHFVLRGTFEVPTRFQTPALYLPLGASGDIFTHPEALLSIDGTAIASADRHHHRITLDRGLADGVSHELMLQGWTGLTGWPPDPNDPARLQIRPCHVVDLDTALQDFVTLAEVTLDTARTQPDPRLSARMLHLLDQVFVTLDTRAPLGPALAESVPEAMAQLQSGLADMGSHLPETLHAIGHAHMDIAYLWPIEQIRQKNARTYTNVLRLMERHDDFHFSHSQPQLYAYTQQDFPEIFEQIRSRVAEGRWEVMGGMWVEPDCNMPGAEALVRQILLGRRYFQDQFGDVETPALWLPDTFGFPWSLPQLMAQAGLKYFVTNKLNWNQTNRLPSSSFWWQGIDGTRVLSHVLTTPRAVQHLPFPTNYKSDLSAAEVLGTVTHATTGPEVVDLPICFGYGDGGGGPNDALVRKAKAFAAMPGAPKVRMSTVRAAVQALERQSHPLPGWNDELYLEGHRGVLTSQGWIKRANRLAERLLHDTEAALVIAAPHQVDAQTRETLTTLWRKLCLNQFHDILTGTSVTRVFDDARADFAEITETASGLLNNTLTKLVSETGGWTLFNPAPVPSERVAFLPEDGLGQTVEGGSLVAVDPVPGYGLTELSAKSDHAPVRMTETDEGYRLENTRLTALIGRDGRLLRLWDKVAGRDGLRTGVPGNVLQAFEDRPVSWDAWDIDGFFEDRMEEVGPASELEVIEGGPLRVSLRAHYRFRNSTLIQEIRLCADSARLDFVTQVDWHEHHTLLKVAFDTGLLSPQARYEIQWGDIARPTHRNTSWDSARFEVPAQKWADLSEAGFGLALLNDCKYGYDIKDSTLRLSLIKSATSPDPVADQGLHEFTYSVMSHAGDLAAVRNEARRLNDPLRAVPGKPVVVSDPLVKCDANNVILETLKPAEDGRGFILRFYEAGRQRGPVSLRFGRAMSRIAQCDLLENDGAPLALDDDSVTLHLNPYQIVSLRCIPA